MTSKTLTFRVPINTYQRLAATAAQEGIHLSLYLRRVIEKEHEEQTLERLREQLFLKLDQYFSRTQVSSKDQHEVLHLLRGIASYLSPQLIAQVKVKLAASMHEEEV